MLSVMDNVLGQVWAFRNVPVPDRCMDPENISEVVYYFLQDKGAGCQADLLYNRVKAKLGARMEKIVALPPREILGCAYEKVIKEEFLCQMKDGLSEDMVNIPLTYPQLLAVLSSEWMDDNYSFLDHIIDTMQDTVQRWEKKLRPCQFHVSGGPSQEPKDYYELCEEELNNLSLEPAEKVRR